MADFKIIFQYREAGKGFQEVWYRNASTIQQAATIDGTLQYALISFRNPLTYLAKARISDVANNRNTVVVNINQNSTFSPGTPAVTGLSAVFNLNGLAPGGTRRIWLRGLSAIDIGRDPASGADKPSDNLILRTNYLWAQLQTRGFELRSLTPIGAPPNIYQRITAISGTANSGAVTLTYSGTSPPVVGNLVKLTLINQKDWPGLGGIFKVLAIGAQTFDIPYNIHTTAVNVPLAKGRWRPVTYQFGILNSSNANFGEFSTRITGKDPLGGRGRRTGARMRLA
jgi:hypothetical protein